MDLRRREFLKVAGVAAAGSVLPGCEREVHNLVPYLLPDEEIVPGVANWYASVCRQCQAGCGILVRVMEGRAKKIEGNPDHPVNQGKLCARGQAALQGLYNPDRLRQPLRRVGARGEESFEPIGWDDGLALWTEQLRKDGAAAAMVSEPVDGTLAELLSRFMAALGGALVFYDWTGTVTQRAAIRRSFGIDSLPHYDLAASDYVLSFGTPFLEHWLSPVYFARAYGHLRQGRPGIRGRVIQIEPRLSLTAANADRWIPIRPGTEGLLAVGIGQVILNEARTRLPTKDRTRYQTFYNAHRREEIAAATGVPEDDILKLAREFAQASAPLAIGGGLAAAQTNGTATLMAIEALNGLTGGLGGDGGVRFFEPLNFPGPSVARVGAERALVELAQEFEQGHRRLLHLYRSNPLHTIPPSVPIRAMFDKADFIVSFSAFLDESTTMADLILPDHDPLESWSDHPQSGIIPIAAVGLGQPVVTPLYDTREIGDVILDASRRLSSPLSDKLPWKNFHALLRERWKPLLAENEPNAAGGFEAAWMRCLQQGGWWAEHAVPAKTSIPQLQPYQAAAFDGEERKFPFYFCPYPSMSLHHGEGANLPWLQELPDTLTTAVWGSWVEVNPKTASTLGLRPGDQVRIVSPHGAIEAPVIYFPGIRPDVIAVPIGQGHTAYGRYAKGRGTNPLSIVGPWFDSDSGALATAATRVRLERTGKSGKLVLLDQRARHAGDELMTIDTKQS